MIAVAPVVADTRFAVHDQRVDLQLGEACGDRKPGLAAAHDQDDRIPVRVVGGRSPEVEPVGTAKIARVRLPLGPRPADLLLEPLDLLERREQRPRFQRAAIAGIGDEAQDSAAAAGRGFEPEDRLDRAGARACHAPGRGPLGIGSETGWTGPAGMRFQLPENGVAAVDRPDAPGQGQHVAPMAIGVEQGPERDVVGFRQSPLEPGQPMARAGRDGLGFSRHRGSQTLDLRRVSGSGTYTIRGRTGLLVGLVRHDAQGHSLPVDKRPPGPD